VQRIRALHPLFYCSGGYFSTVKRPTAENLPFSTPTIVIGRVVWM
jgi:hypothetical protein